MTDAYYQTIANTEYENIMDIAPSSTMDDEFKNFTIVLIAEHTGAIPKNFQVGSPLSRTRHRARSSSRTSTTG